MSDFPRRLARTCMLAAVGLALAACSSFDSVSNRVAGVVKPYKMDVVQGNVITKEQIELLKPGMSRAQVRELMGSALLASMFHGDRWDYVFTLKHDGVESKPRRVTVYFKGDVMERFEADPLPTEAEFVASLDTGRFKVKADPSRKLTASEEDLKKFPVTAKKPDEPAVSATPLPAAYPPLEVPVGR